MVNSSRNYITIILFFFVAASIIVMINIYFLGFFRKTIFLRFFSLYTWHIYHLKLDLFINIFFFIFIVLFFFLNTFFLEKRIFFILYTWNIYHSILDLFIQFILFLSLFFCNFSSFFFTLFFLKKYYTNCHHPILGDSPKFIFFPKK